MLDEPGGHELEPARDVLADELLVTAALRARSLGLPNLQLVDLLCHPARLPARRLLASLRPVRAGVGLVGLLDLALELSVGLSLRLGVDPGLPDRLAGQGVKQQAQLRRVEPLGARVQARPAQLGHQQLEIGVSGQHRLQGRQQQLPRLVRLALTQQRMGRLADLPQRRRLPLRRRAARPGAGGGFSVRLHEISSGDAHARAGPAG